MSDLRRTLARYARPGRGLPFRATNVRTLRVHSARRKGTGTKRLPNEPNSAPTHGPPVGYAANETLFNSVYPTSALKQVGRERVSPRVPVPAKLTPAGDEPGQPFASIR